MADQQQLGQRFSQVYLERGLAGRDSSRFRERLAAYHSESLSKEIGNHAVASTIRRELGVKVTGIYDYDFDKFWRECTVRDLLDSITIVWNLARNRRHTSGELADRWLHFVRRALAEENLGYRVDDQGGVHYFVDEEFERNRVATLSVLGAAKYRAVLDAFESAHRHLDSDPPDTKASVRSAFEAMEILAKLIAGGRIARLGPPEVEQVLKPLARAAYGSDAVASDAANQLLNGLSDWINAAQPYRHGQAVQEPTAPPIELAVSMLSMGATYLRWLIELSQASNGPR
jgi:hypothetical protein